MRRGPSPRPWRAVAYSPGPPRYYFGNTSAKTREGLSRSVERWRSLGLTVDVHEVLPHPEIAAAVDASQRKPAGSE
jgi:hypothetical protein